MSQKRDMGHPELRKDCRLGNSRTALITGASRGLGAAIATELAATGVRVAVNYFQNEAAAARTCDSIRQAGGEALPFQADVRDEAEAARQPPPGSETT